MQLFGKVKKVNYFFNYKLKEEIVIKVFLKKMIGKSSKQFFLLVFKLLLDFLKVDINLHLQSIFRNLVLILDKRQQKKVTSEWYI